jgi:Flp pilus assembly pilin Flp
MNCMLRTVRNLVADDRGGEVIEWAMVCGLIIIATIVTITAFGTKLLARWTSLNASMD